MKRFLALAAAAAALTLTACSSNDTTAEPEADPSADQASESSAESTPLSQEEWVELCGPEGTAPDDPKCFEDSANPTVKVGEWGELVQTFDDGEEQPSGIRVDKVEYKDTLSAAASNPDWDGGEEIPQYIDAEPEDGYQFAVVSYTVKNTSKKPSMPGFNGSVLTNNDAEFGPGPDEEDYAYNLADAADEKSGSYINPGQDVNQFLVVQIEKGDTLKSVYLSDPYMDSYAILQIDL